MKNSRNEKNHRFYPAPALHPGEPVGSPVRGQKKEIQIILAVFGVQVAALGRVEHGGKAAAVRSDFGFNFFKNAHAHIPLILFYTI